MDSIRLLQDIELGLFVLLGLVASVRWYKRRGGVRAWVAVTFVTLATIAVLGRFLPQDPNQQQAPHWIEQIVVLLIVLFPYLLYRFMLTFGKPTKPINVIAHILVALAATSTLLIHHYPKPGEHRTFAYNAYVLIVVAEWLFLLGVVSIKLWIGGNNQGIIARRRMRTLSLGAAGITTALVLTALNRQGAENQALAATAYLFAIFSAPLFLMGFAPPPFIVSMWRRPERFRFRQAEGGLIEAVTPKDVAEVLLPLVAQYIGGSGSLLADHDGRLTGFYGFSKERAKELAGQIASSNSSSPIVGESRATITIPLHDGWLVVEASVFAPYFGKEEMSLLLSLATFTDMALMRARTTERERVLSSQLQLRNEALRDFVAMASHDLRAPINVIKGFATTTKQEWRATSDQDKKDALEIIERQAQQLDRLVDDLLTVSKLDANVLLANPSSVNAHDVAVQSLDQLGIMDFEININVPNNLYVYADCDHLRRILHNYLKNATNHGMPPFEVAAIDVGDSIVFRVTDCGNGISKALEPRLFERFARGENNLTTGSGLGLAIVKGLAETAGGQAWYEPNAPRGSRFLVRIPKFVDLTIDASANSEREIQTSS
jgi:signal transduction histidine kinase